VTIKREPPPAPVVLREALADQLQQDADERRGTGIDFFSWALKAPEPKSGMLDFDRFPFQKELYSEGYSDKEAVIMKSTQVGVSAFGVRWALYNADIHGMTGLYVFPTARDVWDFSTARINPVIAESPYLLSRQHPADPDNKGMKGLGRGLVYFRGSESKRGLDSVDADHIVFDEYDTLVQSNIPDAERRVTGSLHGLIRRVGVPSVPDYGIAKLFDESDQRHWRVKCGCGKWQAITFEDNVDLLTGKRVCSDPDCRKELDVAKGEWVANFPDRDVRGYHITRLIAPTADLTTIIAASKKRAMFEQTVFNNKDLGLPFVEAAGRLSKEAIAAAQSAGGGYVMEPGYHGHNLVTMGVDVASSRDLNVRISEHINDYQKRALWIGMVGSFDHLALLMDRYQVNMAAIDHLPDGRLSRAFCEKFPGRAYLVSYDSTPNPKDSQVFKVDEEMRHIRVRRTEAIDAMAEMIRLQNNRLPEDLPEGYVQQLQALVRKPEEDDLGKRTVRYVRMGGSDDYAHAEVYDLVATEAWYYRQGIQEAQRAVYRSADDMLEFERSHLADYADQGGDYYPGGVEDEDIGGDDSY
jgi:hypothetical protein